VRGDVELVNLTRTRVELLQHVGIEPLVLREALVQLLSKRHDGTELDVAV
jgi:hypothetical protein